MSQPVYVALEIVSVDLFGLDTTAMEAMVCGQALAYSWPLQWDCSYGVIETRVSW